MKKIHVLIVLLTLAFGLNAQTLEDLKSQKNDLESQISDLKSKLEGVEKTILTDFPDYGWKFGLAGTVGANLSGFSNWAPVANPNSRNTTILGSVNVFANKLEEKYFWRNTMNVNLGWQKLIKDVDNVVEGEDEFTQTADIFNFSSLYGYKINEKIAISALGEYRTTLLNNFNNPGYLDLGVGATWTPMTNLVVVFHPLNYNFVFAEEGNLFESSLGTKILADYNAVIFDKITWRSNLSAFLSYKDLNELSNYTWTNSFAFNAFKGIGVGIEYALRINKQETKAFGFDKNLQQYFVIGLTYALAR